MILWVCTLNRLVNKELRSDPDPEDHRAGMIPWVEIVPHGPRLYKVQAVQRWIFDFCRAAPLFYPGDALFCPTTPLEAKRRPPAFASLIPTSAAGPENHPAFGQRASGGPAIE